MDLIKRELANRLISPETRKDEMTKAQKALYDPQNLDSRQLVENWVILGEGYKWEKRPSLAEESYLHAIELIQTIRDEIMLAEAYKALGDVWYFSGNYERCISHYDRAAKIYEQHSDVNWVNTISQIAYAYAQMGRRKEEQRILKIVISRLNISPIIRATFLERMAMSLSTSNAKEAITYYEEALKNFDSANFKRDWEKRVKCLSQLYESIGDKDNAQRTLKRL